MFGNVEIKGFVGEHIDPDKNHNKFYEAFVVIVDGQRKMLVTRYGRIGTIGKATSATKNHALDIERLEASKARKGYKIRWFRYEAPASADWMTVIDDLYSWRIYTDSETPIGVTGLVTDIVCAELGERSQRIPKAPSAPFRSQEERAQSYKNWGAWA